MKWTELERSKEIKEEIIRCRVDGVNYRVTVTAEPEPLTGACGK